MTMSKRRHKASRKTPPRPAWQTDRYLLGLHRHIYLATGDARYRYAAHPGDDMRRAMQGLARPLLEQLRGAAPQAV